MLGKTQQGTVIPLCSKPSNYLLMKVKKIYKG